MEGQIDDGGEDGLGGEMGGAEVGGGEGENFEGEAFRFNHEEAREGETDHGEPIAECFETLAEVISLGWEGGPRMLRPGQQLRPAMNRT